MRYRMLALLTVIICFAWTDAAAATDTGKEIKHSPLDRVTIYHDTIPWDVPIRLRAFGTENADLGTGSTKKSKPKYQKIALDMKEHAPQLALQGAILNLKEYGFCDVAEIKEGEELPCDSFVVEGEFTLLNPGSQSKRYWIGFGAGKSKICAKGRIVDGLGQVWMEFDHCRHEAWGSLGGDSAEQMSRDSYATGSHFAEFLHKWADGKYSD